MLHIFPCRIFASWGNAAEFWDGDTQYPDNKEADIHQPDCGTPAQISDENASLPDSPGANQCQYISILFATGLFPSYIFHSI